MRKVVLLIATLFVSAGLQARPVPFTGAWSFMVEHDESGQHAVANYAVNRSWAPGLMVMRTRTAEGDVFTYSAELNHLLYRKNAAHYQANVFLTGGIGLYDGPFRENVGARLSVQADAEDRRRYIAARYTGIWSSGILYRQKWVGRIGWAPYEAGFNDLNTWLILQTEYETREEKKLIIRPLVRFFYRNILAEFGSSLDGDIYANLTLQHRF
jgi:hypothetical protein